MNTRVFGTRLFWLLGAFLMIAAMLFGQATDGNLVGVVTDSTGATVPGATITATNKGTGVKYTAPTGAAGEYRINNLPVGRYDISASAKGFAVATTADVQIELNHTSSVNLALTVGSVTTTVEVTEAGALLETSSAQLQTNYDSKASVDQPLAGITRFSNGVSGIYNLGFIGAGVASSGGVGQGTGPSISGQRPENNSFTLDGVDNDDRYSTGPAMNVSNEAVAQMNILQNQFSPEFGSASGGIFNVVVKSGTNQLHGSIYEYFQNRDLNAIDAVNRAAGQASLPRYDNNRFGATVGGPIIKDKLFYFGNYEYNPIGQSTQPTSAVIAPTAAGIAALNGIPGLSATNLGVFEKYVPVAATGNGTSTTVNGVNIPLGALSFNSPAYTNNYSAIVAIDWNVNSSDQVRGRFIYSNSTGIDSNAQLPAFFSSSPAVAHSGAISEFHNFSPTMENELRISFRRFTNTIPTPFNFPGLNTFPNLSFDDLGLNLGPDPNTPTGEIANGLGIQENLTKTWGRHTFKMGYQFSDIILDGDFVQRARGDYDYATLGEYLADFSPTGGNLEGVSGERSAGATTGVPFGFLQNSAFFNDDFRVRPNFTLNLGIRYEYVTEPVGSRAQGLDAIANVPGVITFNTPHFSPNDWSPRLGFAYSPGTSGLWSIRGGASRSFDLTYINLNQNASPAYYQTTNDVNPNVSTPGFLAGGGLSPNIPSGPLTAADARAAIAAYTFSNDRPYALTGTVGVQRLLGKDYILEARYVYTKGVHLWNQTRLNRDSLVTPTNYVPTFFTMPSAETLAALTNSLGAIESSGVSNSLAQYGFPNNLTGYHPWGNSRYNGLQLQFTKRYSRNLSYIVAYTWSHNFDDSTATNFSTILSPRRAQDFQNMAAEWASSALDRRQRLTITPSYDFRPFQNGNWLMKNVVGNWSINGTYTYQSPEFATVQSGVDSNLNGDTAGDRAIVNPAGASGVGSGVTGYNALGQAVGAGDPTIVAYVANNSNARYVVAGQGALSNGGRNTFAMGHISNFDFALIKRIALTERFKFDIGAQAFNVFNHAQFVGSFINDANAFGTASVNRAFLVPSSSLFGAYNQGVAGEGFFPSNSRTVQLVAHFVF